MPLTQENIRLFWKSFVSSCKESSQEESKFFSFQTYDLVTLIKSKLQIHPANPGNPDILQFITKFL